jgi:creatinine amidohydrolase/Fe(II)-dependent formamide hydrolase-like protein/7-cyano-7-deazaguanine synthase in queuosine biosynthesis
MKRTQADEILQLKAIDRLEIGPVRIEKKRLIAPYKVTKNKRSDSYDLIYRYQEDVFDDAKNPRSANLAHMIAAQVALNYGLFCQEIIFHGPYDAADQKFINEMMRNTAREIYVKKFCEPNPFLLEQAANFPFVKRASYVQAQIIFDSQHGNSKKRTKKEIDVNPWITDKSRYAILSSGGKDSLLSFALLEEIHREIHPIFINESGRHWFTALNAFRHFAKRYPRTSRVWTNSDRLFAWMLKHLPFVRQDFASIRSDEYPIRLWTVAVFLFGALPIMEKRKIGRLIIGDEFDTTSRKNFKGITHYDGLYDQSRYFDNMMTRYFIQKGWNINQFSLIRTLSELLIEKILTERYSSLQKHQMSCHATHVVKDRIFPCGKCEKCRRIVGMLMALDANPSNCGYSPAQIKNCLADISSKGIHQESAGIKQLMFLLDKKGLIPRGRSKTKAGEHAEIMKVRFDPDKSPMDTMPVDIREPILRIFLEHAQGAVKRQGRLWMEYDPLNDPSLANPYPFELPSDRYMGNKGEEDIEKTISSSNWAEMTWPEAQIRLKEVDVALLPVGSLEQHGPHLPLDTDAFDARYLAKQVAFACSDPKPLVLPLIPYGVSYHHEDFSGTIGISPGTLSQLAYEIGMSAARNGITKLIIINGHGGNIPALQYAGQMINRDARIFTCVETGETSEKDILGMIDTPNDVHAGEIETSTALANRPHMVRQDKMDKFIPKFSSRYLNFSSKRSVEWNARIAKISSSGVLGDPTKASQEKGKKIWAIMIKHLVEFVEDLKNMSLDEIHHKRY